MSDENASNGLFLHSSGPLPTGINQHWKPRIRRRADGRKYIQIDLSAAGTSYRSQIQEATRAYLEAHRHVQARLDYAYCNGDGLGVVANLYFPDHRSDLDGPLKLALDALVEGLDLDDDQIRLLTAFRYTSSDPRLELWVGTLTDAAQLAQRRLQAIVDADEQQNNPLNQTPTQNSKLRITLPDPPSFNGAWQWRIERGESGRVRPVAYLSSAYTRYKQAAKEQVLQTLQQGDGAAIAKSLSAAARKGQAGLGIAITLHKRGGDTDNYIKPTIDALVEALNAADPAFAPLKSLNDRYVTMLTAVKSAATADTPTADVTLAPLPVAAAAAIRAISDALGQQD